MCLQDSISLICVSLWCDCKCHYLITDKGNQDKVKGVMDFSVCLQDNISLICVSLWCDCKCHYLITDKGNQDKVKGVMDHIVRLQDYISSMAQLQVTAAEFAYLKALVLFSPGELDFQVAPEELSFFTQSAPVQRFTMRAKLLYCYVVKEPKYYLRNA